MSIDTDRMRGAFWLDKPQKDSTHYAKCEYSHKWCALAACLDEIDSLRAEVAVLAANLGEANRLIREG